MKEHFEIHFEIEQHCGLSCRHCSSSGIRSSGLRGYSNDDITKMLSLFTRYDLFVSLTGGEPLLHQNIEDVISSIKSSHPSVEIGLFTTSLIIDNGIVSPLSMSFAERLSDVGISFCYVSVYSNKETTHDIMTQNEGSYYKTRKAIQNLITAGIDVRFNTVVYNGNEKHLSEITECAKELGASEVRLLKLVKHGDAGANWNDIFVDLNDAELNDIFEKLKKEYGDSTRITISSLPKYTPCRPFDNSLGCQAGTLLLYVAYDGFVYPCACTKNLSKYKICHISDIPQIRGYLERITNSANFTCLQN